jgi:glycosyltransferase involved in cell wall biosynthesis
LKIAYIYPITSRFKEKRYNPYIDDFIYSFSNDFEFVNKESPSHIGIFDICKYLGKIDVIFLHWIENLPDKKGGILQSLFFIFIIVYARITNISIVWTMHNKLSHNTDYLFYKKILFKFLIKWSDVVLTHSSEGISFADKLIRGTSKKIYFNHHPVKEFRSVAGSDRIYDLFLWGSIAPYKGIDDFVEFISTHENMLNIKILIAGKFYSMKFRNKIESFKIPNLTIIDKFISNEELIEYSSQSKFTLFPYRQDSVLSSGALMESISMKSLIIGPKYGAFKDLGNDGIIFTYDTFDDIIGYLKGYNDIDVGLINRKIDEFITNNTWKIYSKKVNYILNTNGK